MVFNSIELNHLAHEISDKISYNVVMLMRQKYNIVINKVISQIIYCSITESLLYSSYEAKNFVFI